MKQSMLIVITLVLAALICGNIISIGAGDDGEKCNILNKRTGHIQKLDCLLDPESFVGPYYLPLNISRSNITEEELGIVLELNFVIMNSVNCEPVANATVDIWQANATGSYSGIASEGTAGLTFLRGIQVTNAKGEVTFQSIYPGWYTPRAVHIHMEVFIGGQVKHIGRFYFPNIYTDAIRRVYPYTENTNQLYWNEDDTNYAAEGGIYTTFDNPEGNTDSGFNVLNYVGVNPYATP